MAQPQDQLQEWIERVFRVDRRFKEFVEWLAWRTLPGSLRHEADELHSTRIVLGAGKPTWARYSTEAEVPFCRQKYGDGRGTIDVVSLRYAIDMEVSCIAGPAGKHINFARTACSKVFTTPWDLYWSYLFLYRDLGTGADLLLAFVEKAEKAGDGVTTNAVRKLHLLLRASAGRIREIEEADYSLAADREVGMKVGRAIRLLERAREAAKRGDIGRLEEVLGTVVFETPWYRITLGDIIDYLQGIYVGSAFRLLEEHATQVSGKVLRKMVKGIDIYRAFITAAKELGLEVVSRKTSTYY